MREDRWYSALSAAAAARSRFPTAVDGINYRRRYGCFVVEWVVSKKRPKSITEQHWLEAVEAYELGTKHAVEIARDLGVSPATVSRELKRRGCVKACRVHETVAELNAALDEKAKRGARERAAREAAAMQRSAELDWLVTELMNSIIAASKAGDLTVANKTITEVGQALGVKPSR